MTYTCPMHPEVRQESPGACPACGMALVPASEPGPRTAEPTAGFLRTYRPLIVIVGLILAAALAVPLTGGGTPRDVALNFMAGFFLAFAGLKLLDVPGFAKGYSTYDLLARRVKAYGYVYPFLELALGLLYLTRTQLALTNAATFALMLFGGVGVAASLARGRKFQCACLGTAIKVPLTAVTLVENFGMAAMALAMLAA